LVLISGEVTTKAKPEIARIVRKTIAEVGYDRAEYGFDAATCAVLVSLDDQSPDIAQGVNKAFEARGGNSQSDYFDSVGAGDQGMVFGFATDETPEYLPTSIALAPSQEAHHSAQSRTALSAPGRKDPGYH
jgi:S-adenosylmethionine synthetase